METESQRAATEREFSLQLSPTPRGARLARLLATERLRAWNVPYEAAAHVVAELAANAVTHGRVPGRDFRLRLALRSTAYDTIRVEVTDTRGDLAPETRAPDPDAESGRGLLLVEALATRWGVTREPPPRKTTWAELDL
ncbi:ATP-binding protein [Streptomyces sp. SID14478]|uniref:ATP-binding protein n=1 Tax=Streptomyces sp. SID14478 TaxID=2706073 RepID=UPI0013D913B4|nr:ATP-binding protein [Streptomyces sp. SID14478]NEB76752.1 ATP-binding protein [Streptomyces sp. SID14478]